MSDRADIEHPQLGHLEYDDDLDIYTAALTLKSRPIRLRIHCGRVVGEPPALAVAVDVASKIEQLSEAAAACAVRDLLRLKNETWLQEGEKPVSEQKFLRKMVLEAVAVRNRGSAEFFHTDGDLFWGHYILVEMNPDRTFRGAHLAG